MAEQDSLAALQGLHRDLCALIDLKLPVLDRLVGTLEAHLDELKALLDKKPKNDASRRALASGRITLNATEYAITNELKELTYRVADDLDLDELEAAALVIGAEDEARDLDRTPAQTAVIRFHRRRELVLLCVRIMMKTALDNGEAETDDWTDVLQKAVQIIVGVENVDFDNAYKFWAKCLKSMESIEAWLQAIAERLQSQQVTGQVPLPGETETMAFQIQSLTRQHENLAAICTHMIKVGFANLDNFKALLAKLKTIDRHDLLTIHYIPMTIRLASWIALESTTTTKDVRTLHDSLLAGRESDNWLLRPFHAATLTWWLAEYSGRYMDHNHNDPDLQGVDFDKEAATRSEAFLKALDDGAFHFMLSISQDVRPTRWYDPAKTSMITSLLHDTAVLPSESPQPEDFFKELAMEQMQTFIDSFITNMPDTLRRLKVEEDDQRRRLQMSFQHSIGEHPLHLERFLVIVSYAYDGFLDAAEDFWSDKESNLYGFLQWAAKRQPTPRIAMFCEMLRSISTGDINAEAAHKFLLEEGAHPAGKFRRTSTLSYTHIFAELIEFQNNIHEPKKTIQGGLYPTHQNPVDQIVEPESATMLESYLRLLAHLSRQSPQARNWILQECEFNLVGICFGLCTDKVESSLRAAAFDTVAALLVEKNPLRASSVWNNLDEWTVSGFYVGSKQSNTLDPTFHGDFWATLAEGYDESMAFIRLLQSLIEPYLDDQGLNDHLPFPESLGSSRRMPGIQRFIDFAMSRVFAERSVEVQDPLQRHVLRWTCLRFIAISLSTFNENLVVFANKTTIDVDSVIDSSSLIAYITLHPFTRVMEWLFNDAVLKALFESSHYDFNEIDAAPTDSPLVQSLMSSIEVMDLIMKLQATYLDIVRPLVKQQTPFQQSSVSNISLASFEDAILNNLQIIVDLGLYCGTGHETLTIASLQLLQKLASSRKLAVSPAGFGQRSGRSKIVGILEKDNEAERIGRCLANLMEYNENEIEAGPEAAGYIVKFRILDFLNSCLTAVSARPTIAHILLGFSCDSSTVRIADESLWAQGNSLFHAILRLGVYYSDHDSISYIAWKTDIRSRAWEVLQRLWRSPLTSALVMDELRLNELLFIEAPTILPVDMNTPWDGISLNEALDQIPDDRQEHLVPFFYESPSTALQNFLQLRAAFLDYECRELRLTIQEGMSTLKSRVQSVLLGVTTRPGENPTSNVDVFGLFDFIELNIPERGLPVEHPLLQGITLSMLQEEKNGVTVYAIPLLEQLFLLRMKQWRKEGTFKDEKDEAGIYLAAEQILAFFTDHNRRAQIVQYQKDLLRSWVQVLTVMLQGCDFEPSDLTSFVLKTLQVILPKLEISYRDDIFTALQLGGLAEALIRKIDFASTAFEKTRSGDFANDRLAQLFRAALVGIYSPITAPDLREYCYQICFRYIHGTFEKATKGSPLGRHTLNTIKDCGNHLLEVICDDAYSGQGTCKVSALLVLTVFVAIATRQESKYILESFNSFNFVGVLVDNIKHIPEELRAAPGPQVPTLFSYYDASLALLLRICQTRLGAAHVLNAGLFQSIRESRMFDVDPDIGLEFDDPNALNKYFDLILAVLRVINAAVIARGRQNDQTIFQAREFLKENRHSMVAIFKRSVNVGLAKDTKEDLGELVDCFTILVDFTGFLELTGGQYEDSSSLKKTRAGMFS